MIEVGMKLIKCTSPDGMSANHNVIRGDIFTVLEVRERNFGLPAVQVYSERLDRVLLMYVSKHFVREDGTHSIYKSCLWEVL